MAAKAGSALAPKGWLAAARKLPQLRPFLPPSLGQHCPQHCPPQPGPFPGQHGASCGPPSPSLGPPLGIGPTAELIGCSPWTVRQFLLAKGLPHFRVRASGKLIFYRDQVVRWIENQQAKGG
jgi:hypothetical protein